MMRIGIVAAAVSTMAATASPAAAKPKSVGQLKGQIAFTASSSIPDELDEAFQPYIACRFAESSSLAANSSAPSSPQPRECSALRDAARQKGDAKLMSLGVTNAADRKAIVENSFLVTDLNAASNAEYMRKYMK